MNDIETAKALGWFSLALGGVEMLLGRGLRRMLGLPWSPDLVRAFGAREIAVGIIALANPAAPLPLWLRVGGDALDLLVLASALGRGNRQRGAAAFATAAVLGVTALDVATAAMLQHRGGQALRTARAGRVRGGLDVEALAAAE